MSRDHPDRSVTEADRDAAEAIGFLHLLLAEVRGTDGGIRLEPSSPLVVIAERLIGSGGAPGSRTCMVMLRDLVWQVGMFKELVRGGARVEDVLDLLDTDEVSAFLREKEKADVDG